MRCVLVQNSKGNYSFLRGIAPYSGGVLADPGYQVTHIRFQRPVPLSAGFAAIKEHIAAKNRPIQALCAMELRSPRPFTFQGFVDFNAGYIEVLKDWSIVVDGVNPVARTNIAPEIAPPQEPAIYAFSYTVPSDSKRKSLVVAGGGELPEGSLDPHDVIRRGDTSTDALREKVRFVVGLMSGRLKGLGASWDTVTSINMYTVHPVCGIVADEIIRPMAASAIHGLTWHYSRPPIVSIEYEMDLRAIGHELVI